MMNRGKVVIVGAGMVGTSIAYSIMNQSICGEIIIIDINEKKAEGEALDMTHAMEFMNYKTIIKSGKYEDCKDADVIIITASVPMNSTLTDRMALLEKNKSVMKSIVESIMAVGFNGILLVVSNPVDVMTYYAWKLSGLPKEKVIGSGTTLDSARLHYYIARTVDVSPSSVYAFVIGEHGDSEMVAWSTATIGGKDIDNVFKDNKSRIGENPYERFLTEAKNAGWDIFARKGNTSYGIAASVTGILKSILYDENKVYPVSVYLDGEYGVSDVYVSVPTIINNEGAKEIVELHLTSEENEKFKNSCQLLKNKCKEFLQ
nr:L-lactate dehydrogenase [Anaeroplasma bactoclasticum]